MTAKSDKTFVTHLLKRTSFNVSRSRIEQLVKLDNKALLVQLVDKAPAPSIVSSPVFKNLEGDTYPDFLNLLNTELNRLCAAQSGLGDRMLWFWHGLLTTGYGKVNYPGLLWRQHQLMAKYALGNFRQLLIALSTDPAMLIYLDGDQSSGADPNENYARELMELFTMGRGNYTQADVSAAAKVLSGWEVLGLPQKIGQRYAPAKVKAKYYADNGYQQPVTFLGTSAVFTLTSLIDQILQQPATAHFIVSHLCRYFIHDQVSETLLQSLAGTFRQSGYQIRPVLAQLFRDPEFTSTAAMAGRARLPLEWLLATVKSTALSLKQLDAEGFLTAAGQVPFAPANVAGWAADNRWLSAAAAMARNGLAINTLELSNKAGLVKAIAHAANPLTETLNWLCLPVISNQTRAQLQSAIQQVPDRYDQARLLISLALACPEFSLT